MKDACLSQRQVLAAGALVSCTYFCLYRWAVQVSVGLSVGEEGRDEMPSHKKGGFHCKIVITYEFSYEPIRIFDEQFIINLLLFYISISNLTSH